MRRRDRRPRPQQRVLEASGHELLHRARGQLLLEIDRAVAWKVVHEAGELGGDQHAQVLVARLDGDFAGGDDPHPFLLTAPCRRRSASRTSSSTSWPTRSTRGRCGVAPSSSMMLDTSSTAASSASLITM